MLCHCVAPVHQVHLPTCIESSMWAQDSLRELWAVSTGPPGPLQAPGCHLPGLPGRTRQTGPDTWESSLFLGIDFCGLSLCLGRSAASRQPQAARRGEERVRHSLAGQAVIVGASIRQVPRYRCRCVRHIALHTHRLRCVSYWPLPGTLPRAANSLPAKVCLQANRDSAPCT